MPTTLKLAASHHWWAMSLNTHVYADHNYKSSHQRWPHPFLSRELVYIFICVVSDYSMPKGGFLSPNLLLICDKGRPPTDNRIMSNMCLGIREQKLRSNNQIIPMRPFVPITFTWRIVEWLPWWRPSRCSHRSFFGKQRMNYVPDEPSPTLGIFRGRKVRLNQPIWP